MLNVIILSMDELLCWIASVPNKVAIWMNQPFKKCSFHAYNNMLCTNVHLLCVAGL